MKQLRLSEEQLAAMLAKSNVRLVRQMPAPTNKRGPSEKPTRKRVRGQDKWAGMLAQQIMLAGLESPKREFRFAAELGRLFRADLAYPDRKLLIEVDGGCHAVRKRWHDGILRGQIAQQLGYRTLTVMPEQVKSGEALTLVERELGC